MIEPTRITSTFPVIDAALAALPDIMLEEMLPAVVESQLLLQREVSERTPTSGAGTLRESIGAMPVTFSRDAVVGEVGTALHYAQPVELGSRPHFPPIEPLAEWVGRKLGKKGEEGRGIAFAIARKIAKHGTAPRHMFRDGLAATQTQIHEILSAAAERGLRRVSP